MKKNIIIPLYFLVQLTFGQNEYSYFPHPYEDKVREIQYKYDNGQLHKKEKYYYNEKWKLERVEILTPFNFLDIIKEYHYLKNGKINYISYLNKFNYIYKKDEYTYFSDKYTIKRFKLNKLKNIFTYDSLDREIENQTFFQNNPSYIYKYIYIGNNKKYSEYLQYSSDNKLKEKRTIEYNKNNDEVKIIIEEPNKLAVTEVTTYNNYNKILESLRTDSNGRVIRRSTFEYNENSKTRISRAEDNVLSDKSVWLYDTNKQLISFITYKTGILDEIFHINSKTDYFYDNYGILLSTSTYNTYTKKLLLAKKEFYDENRQIIKKEEYYLGKLSSISEIKNGLKVFEQKYYNGQVTRIINLEYDEKGSLILIIEKDVDSNTSKKTKILYDEIGRKTYKNL